MPEIKTEHRQILAAFAEAGAAFIVVGGQAAILQAVPIPTFDVDIVHQRAPDNIERVLEVLRRMNAYFYPDLARRNLSPRASDLAGHGHCVLKGTLGRLDVLCELSGGRGYEELLPHTEVLDVDGMPLRVLNLEMLATVKAEAGRPKDLSAVPVILAVAEERKKRQR